ncbi:MAG: twitch domain-containing radical SAM protein [Pseudobdellovibrio sp.]
MSEKKETNQSDYLYQALEIKKRLNEVSPTMCLAKWLQVSMHLTTGLTQSCYHPPTHRISLDELAKNPKALHNTQLKIQERKQMKAGERPSGCEYCWKVEDTPGDHMSDRFFRSGEPWAREFFDEVVQNKYDYAVNPRYVEVNFNHACNFKCSYCSPHISSSWAEEARKHGAFPTTNPHNDLTYFENAGLMPLTIKGENPYLKAFWDWWPELYKDLRVFRMTGGEPLLDKNTFRVLDWVNENPRPDLDLAITSNFGAAPELINKFIEKVKPIAQEKKVRRFTLFASVDAWGAQAEYIRNGLDFDYFWENIDRYLSEVPRGIVNFIVTMNALSLPNLQKLIEGFIALQKKHNEKYHRIFFDTPFLRHPNWMSLQTLPKENVRYLDKLVEFMEANPENPETFVGIRDFQLARMKRVRDWMKQDMPEPELKKARADHYLFFKEHDRRRATHYAETFPEFENFWKICEQAALS